jgi:predicted NAD/FAD-binding protein
MSSQLMTIGALMPRAKRADSSTYHQRITSDVELLATITMPESEFSNIMGRSDTNVHLDDHLDMELQLPSEGITTVSRI